MRTHLIRHAESTKRVDPRLDIELSPFVKDIWIVYNGLSRPPSMSGISKISQQEILAYQQNYGIQLNYFELEMIEMIDHIAIEVFSKKG